MNPDHRPTIIPRNNTFAHKPCPRCYSVMYPLNGGLACINHKCSRHMIRIKKKEGT